MLNKEDIRELGEIFKGVKLPKEIEKKIVDWCTLRVSSPKVFEAPTYRYKRQYIEKGWDMWREEIIEKYNDGKWELIMRWVDAYDNAPQKLIERLKKEGSVFI